MQRKTLRALSLTLILVLALGLLVGCGQATLTSAKSDLTANQAAELIYHDLTYHGIAVGKVSVTNLTFSDRNTAVADVAYVTSEGNNLSQKVGLKKISGQWEIQDHQH